MNKYYEAWKSMECERDPIFYKTLALLEQKPANILEIGCARSLDMGSKRGDGVSSLFFAEYCRNFGGHLTIVELDAGNLENCKIITEDFKDIITYINDDGIQYLKNHKDFDYIYLDAGDDPNLACLMFEEVDRKRSIVVMDDFNGPGGKGDVVKIKYDDYEYCKCQGCSHALGLYHRLK